MGRLLLADKLSVIGRGHAHLAKLAARVGIVSERIRSAQISAFGVGEHDNLRLFFRLHGFLFFIGHIPSLGIERTVHFAAE